jgi:hypothetical protein
VFLTATAATTATGLEIFFRLGNPGPKRQFGSIWVASGQRHFTIDQNQRQRFGTGAFQKTFHERGFGKNQWLLGKVETLDLSSVSPGPIDIGRKADQLLIDVHAAYAGAATQGGVKYLNTGHDVSP